MAFATCCLLSDAYCRRVASKLVLRLNTDWDAAGAGRSLLQPFQKAKAKICAALNLRNISKAHEQRVTGDDGAASKRPRSTSVPTLCLLQTSSCPPIPLA